MCRAMALVLSLTDIALVAYIVQQVRGRAQGGPHGCGAAVGGATSRVGRERRQHGPEQHHGVQTSANPTDLRGSKCAAAAQEAQEESCRPQR